MRVKNWNSVFQKSFQDSAFTNFIDLLNNWEQIRIFSCGTFLHGAKKDNIIEFIESYY
jgi:hypothetical protein